MFSNLGKPPTAGYQPLSSMADDGAKDGEEVTAAEDELLVLDAEVLTSGEGGDERDLAEPNITPEHTGEERVSLTEEDNKRIRQKTDRVILSILVWVYFLQILDKTILGYSAIFGLQEDNHLTGNQYSLVGSIAPIAQLVWQPFSSILIVKVPHRILMSALVLGWGVAQAATPACHSFGGLLADRFFLGLFEAGCLPLFSVMTVQWYRRSEQPLRVAAWYGTNGLATIVAAALSYGLGTIQSPHLAPWQIIFLSTGLLTIASVPLIYYKLDNDIPSARFLTAQERLQCRERLRANQSGSRSMSLRWSQILEAFLDVKTYLFIAMSFGNNLGAQVTNTFGPLILKGLGFDKYTTTLLNMPFGFVQYVVILLVAWAANRFRYKSLSLVVVLLPILAGLVMLYLMPRDKSDTPALLAGYYLLAFIFGCNTLIVSWILANTAGETKRSVMMSLYNAASSAGNIVGPLLFKSIDAPAYLPGLRSTLTVYCAMIVIVLFQVVNLIVLNRIQGDRRVRNGKPRKIKDHSMEAIYMHVGEGNEGAQEIGRRAFEDLTDRENDEFIYIY